jgi:hypothetical protein
MSLIDDVTAGILTELHYISSVKKFEKLNVSSKTYDSGIFSFITRFWSGESKEKTFDYINDTISKAIRHIEVLKKDAKVNEHLIGIVMNKIRDNRTGIVELKKTYECYPYMNSKIAVLIESIDYYMRSNGIEVDEKGDE